MTIQPVAGAVAAGPEKRLDACYWCFASLRELFIQSCSATNAGGPISRLLLARCGKYRNFPFKCLERCCLPENCKGRSAFFPHLKKKGEIPGYGAPAYAVHQLLASASVVGRSCTNAGASDLAAITLSAQMRQNHRHVHLKREIVLQLEVIAHFGRGV